MLNNEDHYESPNRANIRNDALKDLRVAVDGLCSDLTPSIKALVVLQLVIHRPLEGSEFICSLGHVRHHIGKQADQKDMDWNALVAK